MKGPMKVIDGSSGLMECKICGSRHHATLQSGSERADGVTRHHTDEDNMKQVFKLENVESKEFPKKKITGNTRNAALREQVQSTAKVTGATVQADAKQLAKDYPSGLLKEALKLRLKQEARDRVRTPRMRHFKRDIKGRLAEWNLPYDGPLNESDGRLMWKPHVCVPECGTYNDAETETLLKNDPVNAAEAGRYSRA